MDNLRSIFAAFTVALCFSTLTAKADDAAGDSKPNIILIFADDQGYADIGVFGAEGFKTPHLDRMAREGMKFTDFYVAAPICSASRAALLTGCYCQRVSVTGVYFPRHRQGLNPKEITFAEVLKEQGYATTCIGKWHLGHLKPFLPTSQGFDSYYGIPYSNDMTIDPQMTIADDIVWREGATLEQFRRANTPRSRVPLMRNEEVIEFPADQATLTKRYAEEAVKFIRANRENPFFIYLPHTMPHIPLFATEEYRGTTERGIYGDVIAEMDGSVGTIMKALKEMDLDEKTLIVYTSDNGPWLSKGKAGGSAKPLSGGKFGVLEGGMRVPCIMRWPGKIPAGTVCSEVAATIDLMPTFALLAGSHAPKDRVIDGHDIRPLMLGEKDAKSPHEAYYFYRGNGLQAVRSGPWKAHLGKPGRRKQGEKPDGKIRLFNLHDDIGEKTDVAAENPDVVAKLSKLAAEFDADLKKNRRPAGSVPASKP